MASISISTRLLICKDSVYSVINIENMHEEHAVKSFPLSDDLGVIETDSNIADEKYLLAYRDSDEIYFHKYVEMIPGEESRKHICSHYTELVDELALDECEGADYIEEILGTWCSESVGEIRSTLSINEDDIYGSMFDYTGWDFGKFYVYDPDEEVMPELEVYFLFVADLDVSSVTQKLLDLAEGDNRKTIGPCVESIIKRIASGFELHGE